MEYLSLFFLFLWLSSILFKNNEQLDEQNKKKKVKDKTQKLNQLYSEVVNFMLSSKY